MIRPDSDDYTSLFLRDKPFIDLRAPLEFAKGAFPTSVSLPLMDNQERAKVGTCYKHNGQAAAIKLGHHLVSGENKAKRLNTWLQFAEQHPDGYLYCWRGGLRSKTVQEWLAAAGCAYPRVIGGYKAMRRFLIDTQSRILEETPLLILAGRTGCAKTELLNELPNSIDLEALAHHRGSSFGKHPDGQPAQLEFENALAITLLRRNHVYPRQTLIIEDEGKLIGRSALPLKLHHKMSSAPLVVVDSPLEDRLEHSFHNYILHKLDEWRRAVGDEQAFDAFANDLQQSLSNIRKRLGGLHYQQIAAVMQHALEQHRRGDPSEHRVWIKILLTNYYDPMYDHQLSQKADRIMFRGSREQVRDYFSSHLTQNHLSLSEAL
ncbi:MAG: tRNA 2-selenouridine(34) synthase MnmH [Cardiobacteriales bacterium]|nr:MAG: tRNA 2-selenouridine(34) synthase MnmH [Cardiobacteriales bacterium]